MSDNAKLLILHCLSPLHAGVGQGTDAVDLAIARERGTSFPYLPGSSLKGSLRAKASLAKHPETTKIFGPETDKADEHAGAIAFGDAGLLCLPVRSVRGTFAYVTSPYIVARLTRDLKQVGKSLPNAPSIEAPSAACITSDSLLNDDKKRVYFEDLDFQVEGNCDAVATAIAELVFPDKSQQSLFKRRFCIVHDDVMQFLTTHATDIVTRVSLETETKTAAKGQLWTEENLPSESILTSLLVHLPHNHSKASHADVFALIEELVETELQLGGKSTVGRGRTQAIVAGGAQ